jgi:hypothetical protein
MTASSADGGAWAMTATGAPCWSFCLSLRTRLPQTLDRLAHACELKGALDGLWAVRPLSPSGFPLLTARERVDQISTNGHGARLWASANEPRDVVFQFTLLAAQEDS